MIRFISSLVLVAAFLASTSSNATLTGFTNCTGALSCQITTTPPNPITANPNNGILLAWDEVQNFTLATDLRVDRVFDATADFISTIGSDFLIEAGVHGFISAGSTG